MCEVQDKELCALPQDNCHQTAHRLLSVVQSSGRYMAR